MRAANSPGTDNRRESAVKIHHIALWKKNFDQATQFGATIGPRYTSANRVGFESHFIMFQDGAQTELMTGLRLPALDNRKVPSEYVGWAHVAISIGSEERVRSIAADLDK